MSESDNKIRVLSITSHIFNPHVKDKVQRELLSFLHDLDCLGDEAPHVPPSVDKGYHFPVPKFKTLLAESENVLVESAVDDINNKGQFGYTRLIQATVDGDIVKVRDLLRQGADPTIKDRGGATALDKAMLRGYDDIVSILQSVM